MLITRRTTLLGLLSTTCLAFLPTPAGAQTLAELEEAARKEGEIVSLGCPDDWANWGAQWKAIMAKYGVKHTDTDMSSAEELQKFEAEKANLPEPVVEPPIPVAGGPVRGH